MPIPEKTLTKQRGEIYSEACNVVDTANEKLALLWFEVADVELRVQFGEPAESFWTARLGVERNWTVTGSDPVSTLFALRRKIKNTKIPLRKPE